MWTGDMLILARPIRRCGNRYRLNLTFEEPMAVKLDFLNPIPGIYWFGEGDDMFFIDGERWPHDG